MDFYKYKCPVCEEQFKKGDDIVVCPECGTPHHRECYENIGHCFNKDKHSEDFVFEAKDTTETNESDNSQFIVCPNCKAENEKTMFYCKQCGFPLLENMKNNNTVNQNQAPFGNMPPNGFPEMNGAPFIMVDPMAGFKSEDKVSEDVTAGELSKYVGKNTNYFMRVFGSILKSNKSKFNFSAFLFSGAYFLYRKLYFLGFIFSFLIIACSVLSISIQLTDEFNILYELYFNNYSDLMQTARYSVSDLFTGMTQNEVFYFFMPVILDFIRYAVMIICGLTVNRTYFKHCVKKITKIKKHAESFDKVEDADTEKLTKNKISDEIETKGGVNLGIAISIAFLYMAISYIPLFLW